MIDRTSIKRMLYRFFDGKNSKNSTGDWVIYVPSNKLVYNCWFQITYKNILVFECVNGELILCEQFYNFMNEGIDLTFVIDEIEKLNSSIKCYMRPDNDKTALKSFYEIMGNIFKTREKVLRLNDWMIRLLWDGRIDIYFKGKYTIKVDYYGDKQITFINIDELNYFGLSKKEIIAIIEEKYLSPMFMVEVL